MTSDVSFYETFIDRVIGVESDDESIQSNRVKYYLHQYAMMPEEQKNLLKNMTRSFPTAPLFLFLGLGIVGSNIARFEIKKSRK